MSRNTHGYSKEELELLTDEELAGLEDDSVVDEGAQAHDDDDTTEQPAATAAPEVEKPAAQPEKTVEAAVTEEEKPASPESSAEKPAAPPVAAEPQEPADPEPAAAPTSQPRLLPQYEVPSDAKEQIKAIDGQLDELAKKFDDGELTAAEHRVALRPLEDKKQDLREQLLKQSLSWDSQISTWRNITVPTFLAAHPEYEAGTVIYQALNTEVQKLQAEHDSPFDPSFLESAHRTVQASIRKSYGLPAEPAASPKPTQKREIPPTLAGLPSADMTGTSDGGEFAYLDRLADKDPLAYEEALRKLPQEKLDAYLAV